MRIYVLLLLLPLFVIPAQQRPGSGGGMNPPSITGKVLELSTNIPMEFANIVLFNSDDSTQVTGTVTNKDGIFLLERIRRGSYYLEASYIGFDKKIVDNIIIQNPGQLNIGEIKLTPHTYGTEEILISGQRSPISYEIDKKVIDVGSQFTAASGTAVDILENVPSVTVDIEGNVSLRGSGNFTVLIDGRPTVLDASDVLQQIPASSIQNIEIITNPSAKYDPEGTSGIINIVMKKSDQVGISGVAELNGGLNDQYGAEGILDYRSGDFQANFGANYNKRLFKMVEEENNWTNRDEFYSYYDSDGNGTRGRTFFRLNGSLSYNLGLGNLITLGGRFSDRAFNRISNLSYNQWTSDDPSRQFFRSYSDRERSGYSYSLFLNYLLKFNENGHQLTADISYDNAENEEYTINNLRQDGSVISGQKSTEAGPDENFRIKLDYTLPLNAKSKFEAGYQTDLELSTERTGLYYYQADVDNYVEQIDFRNEANYDKTVHSVYSLYSNKIGRLGFQFGARGEYTGRQIDVARSNSSFEIDRWDFFPSAHFSYEFLDKHQLMTSYTRRINRPRGWQLEPFETWMDAYNVRIGNPGLLPEYIDSYELGYQTYIGNMVFSVEGYYRIVNNKVERISSVYSDGITLNSVDNVGKDYSLGTELFFNFDPISNWNVNLIGNIYDYRIEGTINDREFSRTSFNWNIRFNNIIKLNDRLQLQINAIYNSPSVSSQGRTEDFLFVNTALRYEVIANMLTATLQMRDVLSSFKREHTLQTPDLYTYRLATRESTDIMLNLRFNINNYKQQRRPQNGEGSGLDGDEF